MRKPKSIIIAVIKDNHLVRTVPYAGTRIAADLGRPKVKHGTAYYPVENLRLKGYGEDTKADAVDYLEIFGFTYFADIDDDIKSLSDVELIMPAKAQTGSIVGTWGTRLTYKDAQMACTVTFNEDGTYIYGVIGHLGDSSKDKGKDPSGKGTWKVDGNKVKFQDKGSRTVNIYEYF